MDMEEGRFYLNVWKLVCPDGMSIIIVVQNECNKFLISLSL